MKIVMLINRKLPPGLAANAAAVLGISLGQLKPEIVGQDCSDASGRLHRGITDTVIPVLAADPEILDFLFSEANEKDSLEIIGFNRIAQQCRTYEDYMGKLKDAAPESIEFSGLCLMGEKGEVRRLTGSLPLLR